MFEYTIDIYLMSLASGVLAVGLLRLIHKWGRK